MKNSRVANVLLIVLLALSPSCTFLKSKLSRDSHLPDIPTQIPVFDPQAPLVSPGAEVVRRLADLDPSLAVFASSVEAVERAAMKKTIYGEPDEKKDTEKTAPQLPKGLKELKGLFKPARYEVPVRSSGPALLMFQSGGASASDRAQAAALIGGLITGLKDIFSESHKDASTTGSVKDRKVETKDGATTTMGAELAFNDDGSSTFGIELKTEAEKDGVKVSTELTGKVEGLDCPNAEGQVPLTVRLRISGIGGGVGYTQELTAFIRATVDDNADIVNTTVDFTQGTREVTKGREMYIETGMTVQYDAKNTRASNWRLIRHSQNAAEDMQQAEAAAKSGQDSAFAMALTVLKIAEHKWQNGGCVQIVASSPGNVATSSTNQIPVKVTHKFGGADVPSKLEATLSGEASVDPKVIPRTAGTLTYVAPGERNKNATIHLQASSRRGRATLDLTASTGGQSFRADGVSNGVSFTGEICSLNKPFSIDAKFPGGTAKTTFTPVNAATGSTSVSGGGMAGCIHTGGGNYNITTNPDGTGTLTWTTTDRITCPGFNNSRTATFSLPLKPAPEISCP